MHTNIVQKLTAFHEKQIADPWGPSRNEYAMI
jgi:hypothetical protein